MDDNTYLLDGVEETGEQLLVESNYVVTVVRYKGLRCVAKTLHEVLFESGRLQGRFWTEFMLHSHLRHPNIVLLLGYFYNQARRSPSSVMEPIVSNLNQYINHSGVLSNEISYSILQDVALGLRYLHERRQPIIHRDITARAVFLADNMAAKIGNFGCAVVMRAPDLDRPMTPTPGTASYMPPEAFPAQDTYNSARYDIKLDIFSYGVLMIHIFSGEWPCNLKTPTLSEVDRRQEYLDSIGHEHPLMGLIIECLSNDPAGRPTAAKIHQMESNVSSHFYSNKLEEVYRLQQREGNHTVEVCSRRFEMILKKTIDSIPTSKLHGYVRSELPVAIPESDQSMSVIPFQGNQQAESDQTMSVIPFQGNQQAESDQSMSVIPYQQASELIYDHTSYLNYHLVEDMVEKFADDKLKAEMKEYRTDLETFRKQTTIEEFVVPSTGKHIEKFEPLGENYTELSVKLDKDSEVTTLEDIERLRHLIARELSIPTHATLLYAIEKGSLVVKFFVKVNKFSIKDEVTERFTYCKRKAENILEIRIDGNVLKMDLKEGELTLETEVEFQQSLAEESLTAVLKQRIKELEQQLSIGSNKVQVKDQQIQTEIIDQRAQAGSMVQQQGETAPSKPQLKDLMGSLYHKVADKWKMIGVLLEISPGTLAGIADKCQHDPHKCLLEMLETWLKRIHPPASWATIIEAVEFLGEEQLGRELKDKYSRVSI